MVQAMITPTRAFPTNALDSTRDRANPSGVENFLSNAFRSVRQTLFGRSSGAQADASRQDQFQRTPSQTRNPFSSSFGARTPTAAPARASGPGGTYTVQPGDSLSKIAGQQLGDSTRWRDIADLNGITNPNRINPGQQLRLPGAPASENRNYTVQPGDSLSKIAGEQLGDANRWRDIADLNGITNPNHISPGQQLRLPGANPTQPAPTQPAPTQPAPTQPAPTQPEPTQPAPVDPTPAPTDPAPENRTYTVRPGDSLSKIAGRELGDANRWREIADLNGITNPNRIEVGDQLKLPGAEGPNNPNPTNPSPVGPIQGPGNGNTNAIQLSMDQLRGIVPSIGTKAIYNDAGRFTGRYGQRSAAEQQQVLGGLNQAMRDLNITDPEEAAMFVSQLAHESHGFRTFQEYASGRDYEGRRDLGNTQPGDGTRFKGRGAIQLTGRSNYAAASRALFPDDPDYLLRNPRAVEEIPLAFRVSSHYWQNRSGLRAAAQAGDVRRATRLINGGTNGLADRQQYYNRAIGVLR